MKPGRAFFATTACPKGRRLGLGDALTRLADGGAQRVLGGPQRGDQALVLGGRLDHADDAERLRRGTDLELREARPQQIEQARFGPRPPAASTSSSHPDEAILLARMATPAIVTTFLVSVALMVVSLWGHRRLAGDRGRPGCASMGAFVLSWIFGITATLTGLFLLALVFGR